MGGGELSKISLLLLALVLVPGAVSHFRCTRATPACESPVTSVLFGQLLLSINILPEKMTVPWREKNPFQDDLFMWALHSLQPVLWGWTNWWLLAKLAGGGGCQLKGTGNPVRSSVGIPGCVCIHETWRVHTWFEKESSIKVSVFSWAPCPLGGSWRFSALFKGDDTSSQVSPAKTSLIFSIKWPVTS